MRKLAAGLALTVAVAAHAEDPAVTFGARPAAWGVAISPQGDKIVYLGAMAGRDTAIVVTDLTAGTSKVAVAASKELRPYFCRWKTETRMVCKFYAVTKITGDLLSYTRIFALDADGGHPVELGQRTNERTEGYNQYNGSVLDWLPDEPNAVLMQLPVYEENTIGTNIKPSGSGLSAQRINVMTGARIATVEAANRTVGELGADASGAVRFKATVGNTGSGYLRDEVSYFYRPKGSRDWKPLGSAKPSEHSSIEFDGFDETGDAMYVLKPHDGRQALYKMAADGSERAELVFQHPVVDVDGVLRIGKYLRPVAAAYTVDATAYQFFDPALLKLSTGLSKALPGHPTVSIVDESWDGGRKLVFVGGGDDPGKYYIYNSTSHELTPVVGQRPALDAVKLGAVTAVKYPARDGTLIPGYLTLPPGSNGKGLPAIIMPHGGPSARDELGFDWLAQFFAAKGYAVLQPNFRGSTGYGEAWYAHNGFKSWPVAIGDVDDGARWLAAQGTADPKRIAIFGWSYGGYAALQGAVTDPALYRAVVAVAPVTDLGALKDRARGFSNFRSVENFVGEGPHVQTGSPARNAARIAAPVLLFHGDIDLNVNIEQSMLMSAALKSAHKQVELVVYPGLDHQLDDSDARADMLRKSADFIAAAMPPK